MKSVHKAPVDRVLSGREIEIMKKTMLTLVLLAGAWSCGNGYVAAGVGPGYYGPPPPPPPAVAYARPLCPGPGYVWVPGYHYMSGSRYAWREGYWALPPYPHARWVAPRYHGHRYYEGYWRR